MASPNDAKMAVNRPPNNDSKSSSSDPDAALLADMGYAQDMKRNFSVWSVLGVGFSLTNSWFGISTALVTGINSGGPVLVVYGIILITFISASVGISLAELASAMPNAGGQYFWAYELAPPKFAKFASYLTGWFAWAGSIFTSASVALGLGSAVMGCVQLFRPEMIIQRWHILLAYLAINTLSFLFNTHGRLLPTIATLTLYISLLSFLIILITIPSAAPTHQPPSFVFATFTNNTGWSSPSIAFIVGLINTNWAFACLDCATHLAEEVANPSRMIPIAILGTVAIGCVTSWTYSVAMFFSIQDLQALLDTKTGVPILELFYQAVRSKGAAVALEGLILVTGMGCLVASHTWQSRLCWSFARDNGLPFSKFLSRVDDKLGVPFNAHLVSCLIVSVLGFLYLGSVTAFNSMAAACIVLLYISYSIPIFCLLIKGKENVRHGPFWLGWFGKVANWVLLGWTVFTFVMYSFPPVMPVRLGNMNYVCVVYGVVFAGVVGWWHIEGKRRFKERGGAVEVVQDEVVR